MINNIDYLIWGVFVLLLVLVIGKGISITDNFLIEGFGITCTDFIPFKTIPKYQIIPDTIFVSIASYRDAECSMTLDTIFNKARHPEKIFVGICEQNKTGESKELCMSPKTMRYSNNVRITTMEYTDAKGPTYARYYCADLYRGEQYFMQIDSHVFFEKDWDIDLINMINKITINPTESQKPVLSVYPPTKEQMVTPGFPEMDNGSINADGIPSFYCGWSEPSDIPKRSNKPWAAAGFMFLESKFLYEVPFDPNLSHLFQGEETLFSARLFTHGWSFYVPNKNVCYHHYNRTKAPNYSKDITESGECRSKAEKRVLFLLGLIPKKSVADEFLRNVNNYGLGTYRSIGDFWNASGIDPINKTIERWNDKNVESEKYKGWNFRRSGFEKIRK